jgi:hypothetical protein
MATIEKTDATGIEMGLNTRELIACSPGARIDTEKGNFTESHSSCEKKDWRVATSEHVWTTHDGPSMVLCCNRQGQASASFDG